MRMKRMLAALALSLAALGAAMPADAERIRGDGNDQLYREVCYDPSYGASRRTVANCGLVIDYVGLIKSNSVDLAMENSGDVYWFKSGVMGDVSVIGVEGDILELSNPTAAPITVKWADSSLSLGAFDGVPATEAALGQTRPADLRLLPGKTVLQRLYIAKTRQAGGDTVRAAAYVRADGTLRAELYLHADSEYVTAASPAIVLPEFVLEPYRQQNG